uniref:Uncharacterized protein n=1 Tax=Rhizochromulina marina TaxID=1034831 RepID=A0A7S2SQU0_9STRA|mmetsp:Transcript_3832/g.11209  ORF Transcript_3832/g.11209 Transcript_3832/m.11209 type:complete len:258 (+) Transcript_3832:33-806(+)
MALLSKRHGALRVLAVLAMLAVLPCGVGGRVQVSLHFESLCKQCQIHVAAVRDDVLHGGLEVSASEAGVAQFLNMSIDYYGNIAADGTCESAANGTEHGPAMCVTDRYHLCAQHALPTTSAAPDATRWFQYVHCMFQNIDVLKCGSNGYCAEEPAFRRALDTVHGMCSSSASVDGDAIAACASGSLGRQLQAESYDRTKRTRRYGFAPVFIDGNYLEGADAFWRKTPDQLLYGRTLLEAICTAPESNQSAPACTAQW